MTKTNLSLHGIDANNETSLLEYGLLVSNELDGDGSGTRFCVYRIDDNHFGTGHFKESELDAIVRGEECIPGAKTLKQMNEERKKQKP